HRRHRSGDSDSTASARAAEAGRAHGHSRRRPLPGATADADRKTCRRDDPHRGVRSGGLRGAHPRAVAMPVLAAVSLLSAAAVAYEILLTRLFAIALWHHFAYMIISMALLGYGASGTFLVFVKRRLLERFGASFAALAVSFGVAAIGCYALAWRLPFNPLEVIWDWRQQLYLAAMYLTLALPFFAAASAIGLSLVARSARIAAIYRADLTGAGTGAFAIVLARFALPPEDCLR